VLGWAVATGAALVIDRRFDSTGTIDLVRQYGVTRLPLAPPALTAFIARPDLKEALQTVKVVLTGASALDRSVAERFQAATGLFVHQGYGLTEASPAVTTTLGDPDPTLGAVGRPLPGVEIRIADDHGEDVEGDDPGEVLVRGENLFSGYWPDGAFGPAELPGLGPGWIRTGDVGYLDADGDLHLVDRVDDLIIVNGFNVYPREVEDVLLEHPGVREAAAIGMPHEVSGEAVRAVLVPVEGEQPSAQEIVEHCAARLARFKVPVDVALVDSLPHLPTGKLARRVLREGGRVGSCGTT
ncbi:MAG: class I adenylate-forming enzyme family protein, partial [Pseudonocardiaceae bacterium]